MIYRDHIGPLSFVGTKCPPKHTLQEERFSVARSCRSFSPCLSSSKVRKAAHFKTAKRQGDKKSWKSSSQGREAAPCHVLSGQTHTAWPMLSVSSLSYELIDGLKHLITFLSSGSIQFHQLATDPGKQRLWRTFSTRK